MRRNLRQKLELSNTRKKHNQFKEHKTQTSEINVISTHRVRWGKLAIEWGKLAIAILQTPKYF